MGSIKLAGKDCVRVPSIVCMAMSFIKANEPKIVWDNTTMQVNHNGDLVEFYVESWLVNGEGQELNYEFRLAYRGDEISPEYTKKKIVTVSEMVMT